MDAKRLRILHVSPAHSSNDPRIVYKQTRTLASRYDVWCALPRAQPHPDSTVRFIWLPYFQQLGWRFLFCHPVVLWHLLRIRPAILHIYMPELLPVGFLAYFFGVRVIYEVQENLYKKIPRKRINKAPVFQWAFRWFDRRARQHFPIIFTEHRYLDEYSGLKRPYQIIYNFPDLDFLTIFRQPYRSTRTDGPEFLYIGLINLDRGIDTLIAAVAQLRADYPALVLHLFGPIGMPLPELEALPGYDLVCSNLVFYGYTDHRTALPFAARCIAGLSILKPVGDYPDSYSTKLFEYMALGLPVITSDFPLYADLIDRGPCGFRIDPYDSAALAQHMRDLIEHPAKARKMGEHGRQATEERYNWTLEKAKLMHFYNLLE